MEHWLSIAAGILVVVLIIVVLNGWSWTSLVSQVMSGVTNMITKTMAYWQ